MANEILLFVLFTILVWTIVVAFFVKESDPDAATPYLNIAKSGKGLIALSISAILGYVLFIANSNQANMPLGMTGARPYGQAIGLSGP